MRILIIQTGGTIDKCYPRSICGYAFEFGDSYASRFLKQNSRDHNLCVKCITPFVKDSLDMNDADRAVLLNAIKKAEEQKICITHGTDTMIETAKYLAKNLPCSDNKCIIITGSFLPGVFKGTDADFNVAFAMGALACANNTGVFIAIQGGLFRPDQVTRNQSSGHFVSVAKANGNT
ncbi:L-asparaginase/GlutRNAGln amidotransferase subunit D [Fasciolopsis buskii]|uniref:L-asparaginase/GlutRNAGln amidotransferase subunit D n=1 Tax=Fasciolopsis buskii TaxID=27845 RepID=A0A8E0RJ17_9TREM|nr:L-asparaginase/GlutRNAGln amidotransferase subunit D [Fasciolopsis buski]